MATILCEFETDDRMELPRRYRLVDTSGPPYSGQSDTPTVVLERFDGWDALGQTRWVTPGLLLSPALCDLLNSLRQFDFRRKSELVPPPPLTTMTYAGCACDDRR